MKESEQYKNIYVRKSVVNLSGRNAYFTADTHFRHANMIKYSYRPFMSPEEKAELDKFPRDPVFGFFKDDIRKVKISVESVRRMNKILIDNINAIVKPKDFLFHLGDFGFFDSPDCLREFRSAINCRTIYLTPGNHDDIDQFREAGCFNILDQCSQVNVHGQTIIIGHYSMATWDGAHRGWWNLFGHSHGSLNPWIQEHMKHARNLDVGVDAHNYKPWSFEEIRDYMSKKEFKRIDHHGQDKA